MFDKAFLTYIHERLLVHGDPYNIDYMGKLRSIINATDPAQLTPNTGPDIKEEER